MPTSRKKRVSPKDPSDTGTLAAAETQDATSAPHPPTDASPAAPISRTLTDQAVLSYLKEKGLNRAYLELNKELRTRGGRELTPKEQTDFEEASASEQRRSLARATGGGFGYDLDAAYLVPMWGVPDVRDEDDSDKDKKQSAADRLGQEEARAYLNSFTALQLWVMTLPDDPAGLQPSVKPLKGTAAAEEGGGISISSIVTRVAGGDENRVPESIRKEAESIRPADASRMPASIKPELLAVTFALLVHTYCELLDVGIESTAHTLLDTFKAIYEPLYAQELSDLIRCNSAELMARVVSHNSQHLEAIAALRHVMVQVASYQMKMDEASRDKSISEALKRRKVSEYDKHVTLLKQKYDELSKKATLHYEKTKDFAFVRRARVVRWQLTLSASAYTTLAAFLSSRESLLPMSALLQSKCEIHVERRDPLPYTPPCVLEHQYPRSKQMGNVQWAAPVAPAARLAEAGETVDSPSQLQETEQLPFPPLHMKKEYESKQDAHKATKLVEFNRSLLTNGFRRLEAIERIRDYEMGFRAKEDETKKCAPPVLANPTKPSILLSTLCSSESTGNVLGSVPTRFGSMDASTIWEESGVNIACARMCPPDGRRIAAGCDDAAIRIWSMMDSQSSKDKGGSKDTKSAEQLVSEAAMVLLGHKNGFPVFDVNWNRDGRSLLSAGGDGSIRLWDTLAVGPYGNKASVSRYTTSAAYDKAVKEGDGGVPVPGLRPESTADVSGAALAVYRGHAPSCPVWSAEFAPSGYYFASAAADATGRIWTTDRPSPVRVLSGHTSASVNTITWHPNCNYVLTGCDDKTVRMWDIHSGRCVRLLSGCGDGINIVRVSPSGKYAAGADYSGIVHVWDLSTGKKVNELRSDASVGSKRDATGFIRPSSPMIHSMSYSACGMGLATGGDDCVVRIWDTRGMGGKPEYAEGLGPDPFTGAQDRPGTRVPTKSFPTRRTAILDLQYTKRNLLMACGKYATAVPLATPIGE